MKKLINLTQHTLTDEQINDLIAHNIDIINTMPLENVQQLITFNDLPTVDEIRKRAFVVAEIANLQGATHALIGGAGYLMLHLEQELTARKIQPLHAFSVRTSQEVTQDGKTVKTSVFKHVGFIGGEL